MNIIHKSMFGCVIPVNDSSAENMYCMADSVAFIYLLDIQSKLSIVMIDYCFTKKSPWIENEWYPVQSFRLDMPVILNNKRDYTLFL
jgi:hypothetical protein